jgi:hypothetical protein
MRNFINIVEGISVDPNLKPGGSYQLAYNIPERELRGQYVTFLRFENGPGGTKRAIVRTRLDSKVYNVAASAVNEPSGNPVTPAGRNPSQASGSRFSDQDVKSKPQRWR